MAGVDKVLLAKTIGGRETCLEDRRAIAPASLVEDMHTESREEEVRNNIIYNFRDFVHLSKKSCKLLRHG